MFFAAVLTLLVGSAMSASILHKEIDIGHNGVHYKVTVDAEKYHTDHSLGDTEEDSLATEHHADLGKIGLHYEVPHSDLHHHDEEGKHHGVVLHIELGSEAEEHHGEHQDEEHHGEHQDEEHHGEHQDEEHHGEHQDEEHHGEHQDEKHHGLKHHEEHHGLEFPEYENTNQDWKQHWGFAHHGPKQSKWQNDELEHGLKHDEPEHTDLEHIQLHHGLEHNLIGHGTQQYHKGHIQKHLGYYGHGGQQWGNLGEGHYGTQTGKHILGQEEGTLWHLLHPTPIQIQGDIAHYVPIQQESHYGYGQGQHIGQPLTGFEVLHAVQHPDVHH